MTSEPAKIGFWVAVATWFGLGAIVVLGKPVFRQSPGVSTATITHTLEDSMTPSTFVSATVDVNKVAGDQAFAITADASAAQYPFANLLDTVNLNSVQSNGAAGIGYAQTATSAKPTFSGGTGVDQYDLFSDIGNSTVTISFNEVFKIKKKKFKTTLATAELIWAGQVGTGADAFVELNGAIDYYKATSSLDTGTKISALAPLQLSYLNNTSGSIFSESIFGSTVLTEKIARGKFLRIEGSVEFKANNSTSPSNGFFDPDLSVAFNTFGDLTLDTFMPAANSNSGSFSVDSDWSRGQKPDANSVVILSNPTTQIFTCVVDVDTVVKRIQIQMDSDPNNRGEMKLHVANGKTLTARDGIAMNVDGRISLGDGAMLKMGRSLLASDFEVAGNATINVIGWGDDLAVTGSFNNEYGWGTIKKVGNGDLVLYKDNPGLDGTQWDIHKGVLQLQKAGAAGAGNGTDDFDVKTNGVLAANFDFGQDLIDRIDPNSDGTLGLVRTGVTRTLDFTGRGQLFLGATDRATISGEIVPGIDLNSGQSTYRFGGAGGRLDVAVGLTDVSGQSGTSTSLIVKGGGPGSMIVFNAASSFTGSLNFQDNPTIGIGRINALGLGTAPIKVGLASVVFTDTTLDATSNIGRTLRLVGTGNTTVAQVGWDGNKTITSLNQVGSIVGSGGSGETRVLGLGAIGDSGTLTVGFNIADIDAGVGNTLRLVLGGTSTVDLEGRTNTHTGGNRILDGTVLADSFANFGGTSQLIELVGPGAVLAFNQVPATQVRTAIKRGLTSVGDWSGISGITSAASLAAPNHTAVGYFEQGAESGSTSLIKVASVPLGDTDLNGFVLKNDYDTARLAFNPLLLGARWQDGDFDYNDKVDSVDLANLLAHMDKSLGELLDDPDTALLIYDSLTGNVKLKTVKRRGPISNFILRNASGDLIPDLFAPPNFTTPSFADGFELSWSDVNGFLGTADLGNILPGSLTLQQVRSFLSERNFVGEPGSGIHQLRVVPEPAGLLLLLPLMAGLSYRRRHGCASD